MLATDCVSVWGYADCIEVSVGKPCTCRLGEFGVGKDLGLVTRGTPLWWATFSPCEKYRYALCVRWDPGRPIMVCCGLNPSTADEHELDPTLKKVREFAKRNKCGGFIMVNAFALRSTDPKGLKRAVKEGRDPVGEHNNEVIRRCLAMPLLCLPVAAWGVQPFGNKGLLRDQILRVRHNGTRRWKCFGKTKDGHPRHPSRIGYTTPLEDL